MNEGHPIESFDLSVSKATPPKMLHPHGHDGILGLSSATAIQHVMVAH
jgi:hypothetical protein